LSNAYTEGDLRTEATLLLAQTLQAQGESEAAQDLIHTLIAQTQQPYALRAIHHAQTRLALAAGDLATASRWRPLSPDQPLPLLQREAETLLAAQLQLAQGKPTAARTLLHERLSAAQADGRGHNTLEMLLLTALAAHAANEMIAAKQALCEAVKMAQPHGYQRLFLSAGEAIAEMLRCLLREIKEETLVGYVRTLLLTFAEAKSAESELPPIDSALLVEPLSGQERRVLRLLAADLSYPQIAKELVVSLNTVKTHVKNIYSKLDVHSHEEASDLARQLHLV
jgi:LuxR family maltose regulon positive regulatory protein